MHNSRQIRVQLNRNLDLAARWRTPDSKLCKDLANLVDTLALLLWLVIRVIVRIVRVGRWSLLSLWLWLLLGDLDVGGTLDNLDHHVTASLWCGNGDGAADWSSGLLLDDWGENAAGLVVGDGEDTDGVWNVLEGADGWVGGLLDVLGLKELDERGLNGGTAGGELGWVDSGGAGGWGEDLGGLWEDGAEVVGDLWGMGDTSGEDDLINVEDIEAGLLDGVLDEAVEAIEDLAANGLVAETVDGGREVNTLSKGLDGEGGIGADGEGLLAGLGLGLELGERAGLSSWVGGVPLDELLGEVVHQDLVEVASSKVVVVGGGEDSVHAASRGNNGNIRAGSTKVGNDNSLVGKLSIWAGIVGEESSGWLGN